MPPLDWYSEALAKEIRIMRIIVENEAREKGWAVEFRPDSTSLWWKSDWEIRFSRNYDGKIQRAEIYHWEFPNEPMCLLDSHSRGKLRQILRWLEILPKITAHNCSTAHRAIP